MMRVLLVLAVLDLNCMNVLGVMFEEMRHIGRLALETENAQAANRTGSFIDQVATQSANFVAEMRLMQEQQVVRHRGAHNGQGPSHAFPYRHVVERGVRAPRTELDTDQTPSMVSSQLRVILAIGCLCTLLVSGLVTSSRKSLTSPGPQKRHFLTLARFADHSPEGEALSVWDGTVATFSCVVGTGLLAMPYAFSLAGMVAAPVVIFFVLCSAYTAHLMAWSLSAVVPKAQNSGGKPTLHGWGVLVEAAFGCRAKAAINAFLIVELWGYLLSCIVCTAMNLNQLTEELDTSAAVCISAVLAYALTFMPTRLLTNVSVASNMVFILCCLMFLVTGLLLPARAPASEIEFVKPRGLMLAAGILVFSPAGHSFYPALIQRMEEPAKFPMCLRRAYAAACLLYLAVAIPGYYLFGNAARPSAVQNIGADLHLQALPDLGWMNTVAAVGMIVKMLALQPLVLSPLASTVESVLVGYLSDFPLVMGVQQLVVPGVLVVSAAVACKFAHEMATLLNLIGSVFCMNVAFVVPVLCYWKLSEKPLGPAQQALFVGLVVMGGTFAVLGVWTSM